MRRYSLTKFRQSHHGRILVPAVQYGVSRFAPYIFGARIIRKALAEINRSQLPGEPRHDVENSVGEF